MKAEEIPMADLNSEIIRDREGKKKHIKVCHKPSGITVIFPCKITKTSAEGFTCIRKMLAKII